MLNRKTSLAFVALTALLTACGDSGDAAPSTNAQNAAAAISPAITGSMRPGLYRIVQTGDVEIEEERCFTSDDVASGRFAPPDSISDGWVISTNRASGGRIEVSARHPDGARMTITGNYQPDSFVAEAELNMVMNGAPHRIRTIQQGTLLSASCEDEFVADL